MAGPPNSVAIAAPIPNSYFASVTGAAAALPTAHTQLGHAQPVVATPPITDHPEPISRAPGIGGPLPVINLPVALPSPIRTILPIGPGAVRPPTFPGLFQPVRGTIGDRLQRLLNAGQFTNPLSYWGRQIQSRRFGRVSVESRG